MLKELITENPKYDEDFVKNLHSCIIEDRKENEAHEELRRDEVELQIWRIETEAHIGPSAAEMDCFRPPNKEKSRFMHKYESKEDFSLYLISFE